MLVDLYVNSYFFNAYNYCNRKECDLAFMEEIEACHSPTIQEIAPGCTNDDFRRTVIAMAAITNKPSKSVRAAVEKWLCVKPAPSCLLPS